METGLTVKNLHHHSWALMVQEQSGSGLNIRDWCSQNNISTKTFYYRRKQVRSELLQAASPVFAELAPPEGGSISLHQCLRWYAMLRDGTGYAKTYIAVGFTDMRLGIDSLALLIQENFHLNPLEKGSLFLFCGRRSDRIKCLVFEGDGYCLLYKRLVPGFRYQWPRTAQEVKELTPEQFHELMKGFNPLQKGLIGDVQPERVG